MNEDNKKMSKKSDEQKLTQDQRSTGDTSNNGVPTIG